MINFEIGTKFNDVLTSEIIKTWDGNNVILNGATGCGKTYFIENNLHGYAKKHCRTILFLCNRRALYEEIMSDKEKLGLYNIEVMLYQTLQEQIKKGGTIQAYNYIVCDEFHYVLSDAIFNKYTDLTYNWITSQNEAIKIFMSGTGHRIFNKLKSSGVVKPNSEYVIPYDYSYVNECRFFRNKEKVIDIINNILNSTEDKIIYFANSIDFAIEVYNQFENESYFRCSKHSKNPIASKLNKTYLDCVVEYEKDLITFNKRLLVTTKALDNGINIKDNQIKHIICDIFDLESAQQCLGRKRIINKEDKCNFYIRNYSKKEVGRFKGLLNSKKIQIKTLIRDKEEYMAYYGNNREHHNDYIFYDGEELKYNELAYWEMLCQSFDIVLIEKNGYKKTIIDRLGNTLSKIIDLDELEKMNRQDELSIYLEKILDKRLYKKQQKELIDKINLMVKGKQYKAVNKLNLALKISELNYEIISKRVKENGILKTIWIVNKM